MIEIDKRKKSKVKIELDKLAISSNGRITKKDIVAQAQKKGTALHDDFEKHGLFDAKKTMRFAQLIYAGMLLRQYKVWVQTKEDTEPIKTRAFVSLTDDMGKDNNNERGYRSLVSVMSDKEQRESLLNDAKKELNTFKNKYITLTELAPVFEAIGKVT